MAFIPYAYADNMAIRPERPTSNDPITVLVEEICPALNNFSVLTQGNTVVITQNVPSGSFSVGSCTLSYELGRLPAGSYHLEWYKTVEVTPGVRALIGSLDVVVLPAALAVPVGGSIATSLLVLLMTICTGLWLRSARRQFRSR